ncbi:SusC/RagA family TonB-linked outer membrane protein [Salinibacter grassmerensis]|uniref:SusC/RagA family TonB-linked outer membrane protein n=1 Tax=Salinibacter grassmerensis TaxID=3040353 RepID=UPI0021E80116|nr:SusC/RagA family TonB-linked outer membrane protein [Salinibacter grassmerensis]
MLNAIPSCSPRTLIFVAVLGALLACGLLGGTRAVHAQDLEVTGTVVSADNQSSLPGVNIRVAGTSRGTVTGPDGGFSLVVDSPQDTLTFSFIGYQTKTVPVDGRSEIRVVLETQSQELEGVVVTALGIERQQRSVGYATSSIEAQDLVSVTESNPANLLQGNVPGLVLSSNASGPNASSNINIRGVSSIAGNNDPLFIVDGIPIDNTVIGEVGKFGGRDGGSALSVVNPENISDISVLKGAGAAALYGTRARDGVVLITTKTGRTSAPGEVNVQYSSTVTAKDVVSGFSDFQSQYGQGTQGRAPSNQDAALSAGLSSWGAPLDAVGEAPQFDGTVRPYGDVANRQGFYRMGLSQKHSLSINAGFEDASLRMSASHQNTESVVPNSSYEQTNVSLRGKTQLGGLTADASVTYQNELTDNRTFLNDGARNPNYLISFLPNNVPKSALQPGATEEGVEKQFTSNGLPTNPYWAVNEQESDDDKDRILGNVNLNYSVNDWFSLQGQTGLDWYSLRRTNVDAFGSAFEPGGSMTEDTYRVWESNSKLLATATPSLTDELSLRLDVGGSLRHRQFEQVGTFGRNFGIPDLETISNTANPTRNYDFSEQQIRSVFGSASFTYRDYLFLTLTTRSDWSSTIPEDNNPFVYPSVSGSFVFSDAFDLPDVLSYGKVRASWAEIGGDTDPYRTRLTYRVLGRHENGGDVAEPLEAISQLSVPERDLTPTSTREVELGFETQFFDDRFGVDFTWYRRSTVDQILDVTVSSTSGYTARTVNSGEVQNTGVELLLTSIPFSTENWTWDSRVNFGSNRSEVKSLAPGLDVRIGAESTDGVASIAQVAGQPVNAIYGNTYVRDDQGRIVHGEDGLPLSGEKEVLGTGAPDWTLGFSNTISYQNVSLNFLIDAKWGGKVFSGTNANAYGNGLHKATLDGRAACDEQAGPDGQYPEDCFVGEGVIGSVNSEGKVTVDRENDVGVRPSEYYGRISGEIAEEFVYDANFIKLRQLRLSYDLPGSVMNRVPVRSASVSVVGRNLFYLYDSVPNVSPESSYNSEAAPGFEQAGVPQSRSIGASVNLRF